MSDKYRVCCDVLHVKQATWIIAAVHLIIVGLSFVSGALYWLGITDSSQYHKGQGGREVIDFGKYGFTGYMVVCAIWLIFIFLLMYGLLKNRADFVLFHLIAAVVMAIVIIAQIILLVVDHGFNANIIWLIFFVLGIVSLLHIEYLCYQYLKHAFVLPH